MEKYRVLIDRYHYNGSEEYYHDTFGNLDRLESLLAINNISLEELKNPITERKLKDFDALIMHDSYQGNDVSDIESELIYEYVKDNDAGLFLIYTGYNFKIYHPALIGKNHIINDSIRLRKIGRKFGISDLSSNDSLYLMYVDNNPFDEKEPKWEILLKNHQITRGLNFVHEDEETKKLMEERKELKDLKYRWPKISDVYVPLEINENIAEALISVKTNIHGEFNERDYHLIKNRLNLSNEEMEKHKSAYFHQIDFEERTFPIFAINKKYRVAVEAESTRAVISFLDNFYIQKEGPWGKLTLNLFNWLFGIEEEIPKTRYLGGPVHT